MMKKFMLAYISPEYGLLMTQVEGADYQNHLTWAQIELALKKEGESDKDISEIYDNGNYVVKEIR